MSRPTPATQHPRRSALFISDPAIPQHAWDDWIALFASAGHPAFVFGCGTVPTPDREPWSGAGLGELAASVESAAQGVLRRIDDLDREPCIVGFGLGALVALRVADECGAAATVAIGGPPFTPTELGIEIDSGLGGPILLVGGEQDPELSVAELRARHAAYREGLPSTRLLLRPGSASELAFGDGWRETAEAALEFFRDPTRWQRVRRVLADVWESIIR